MTNDEMPMNGNGHVAEAQAPEDFRHARGNGGALRVGDPRSADRLPPHSVEAEQGVLGCILLSPMECLAECERQRVEPEWFYDLRHRGIYQAIRNMRGEWIAGTRPLTPGLGAHRPALGGHRPPLQASEGERERRPRMFPSMDDWLDDMPAGIMDQDGNWLDPVSVLADVLKLIHDTPNLDWLLLTKRPEEWQRRVYKAWEALVRRPENEQPDVIKASDMVRDWLDGIAPANVWPGVSMEDQPRGEERIPQLLKIPARVRFLSVEPLLGPVDVAYSAFNGADSFGQMEGIHWVIVGGESGHWARPCNVDWIRQIVGQCKAAGVPCFVKQLGACLTGDQFDFPRELTRFRAGGTGEPASFGLDDAKGGDMAEWPKDLRVREFPEFNVERRA